MSIFRWTFYTNNPESEHLQRNQPTYNHCWWHKSDCPSTAAAPPQVPFLKHQQLQMLFDPVDHNILDAIDVPSLCSANLASRNSCHVVVAIANWSTHPLTASGCKACNDARIIRDERLNSSSLILGDRYSDWMKHPFFLDNQCSWYCTSCRSYLHLLT